MEGVKHEPPLIIVVAIILITHTGGSLPPTCGKPLAAALQRLAGPSKWATSQLVGATKVADPTRTRTTVRRTSKCARASVPLELASRPEI